MLQRHCSRAASVDFPTPPLPERTQILRFTPGNTWLPALVDCARVQRRIRILRFNCVLWQLVIIGAVTEVGRTKRELLLNDLCGTTRQAWPKH